jgi:hypothetical protein
MSTKSKSIVVAATAAAAVAAAVVVPRLARIFGRPLADTGYDATKEAASDGHDSFDGYVGAIEEARERRGRLFHRH